MHRFMYGIAIAEPPAADMLTKINMFDKPSWRTNNDTSKENLQCDPIGLAVGTGGMSGGGSTERQRRLILKGTDGSIV